MHVSSKVIAQEVIKFVLSLTFACGLSYLLAYQIKPWSIDYVYGLIFIWLVVAWTAWCLFATLRRYSVEADFRPFSTHQFTISKSAKPLHLCAFKCDHPAKIVLKVKAPWLFRVHFFSIPKHSFIELSAQLSGEGIDQQPKRFKISRLQSDFDSSILEYAWDITSASWYATLSIHFDPQGDRKLERTKLFLTVMFSEGVELHASTRRFADSASA